MIAKIVVLFAALSIVYGQGMDMTFCQEKLIKEIRGAKKANFSASAMYDPSFNQMGQNPCKVRCQLYISGKEGSSQETHGEYVMPDYARCGMSLMGYCMKGKCVGNNFCREKIDKEVKEMMQKKGMYPLITIASEMNKKPCEIHCNMTADHKTVTRMFPAPDYSMCGSEEDGIMNICKANKCVTPDGKTPKRPGPSYIM